MSDFVLKDVVAIETPYGLCKTKTIEEYNKEIINKVKLLLLRYTYYDSMDDITIMDTVNFEIISEELDNLFED